jgi:hypothetical protein
MDGNLNYVKTYYVEVSMQAGTDSILLSLTIHITRYYKAPSKAKSMAYDNQRRPLETSSMVSDNQRLVFQHYQDLQKQAEYQNFNIPNRSNQQA